jgi:hypothetical protein
VKLGLNRQSQRLKGVGDACKFTQTFTKQAFVRFDGLGKMDERESQKRTMLKSSTMHANWFTNWLVSRLLATGVMNL